MHRCGKGQNRNIPSPFDGHGYFSLVFGTIPGDPSRNDLPSFCNEITKDPCILIVDFQLSIGAESTDLSPQERFLFSFGRRLLSRFPHLLLLSLYGSSSPGDSRASDFISPMARRSMAITSVRVRFFPSGVFQLR